MFSLISGLFSEDEGWWSWFESGRKKIRPLGILLVGLDGAGKTMLFHRLQETASEAQVTTHTTAPTVGLHVAMCEKEYIPDANGIHDPYAVSDERGLLTSDSNPGCHPSTASQRRRKIRLMDVGGKAELRDIWKHYYEDADVVIFVVDIMEDEERMDEAMNELETRVLEHSAPKVLFVGNKRDLLEQQQQQQQSRIIALQHKLKPLKEKHTDRFLSPNELVLCSAATQSHVDTIWKIILKHC